MLCEKSKTIFFPYLIVVVDAVDHPQVEQHLVQHTLHLLQAFLRPQALRLGYQRIFNYSTPHPLTHLLHPQPGLTVLKCGNATDGGQILAHHIFLAEIFTGRPHASRQILVDQRRQVKPLDLDIVECKTDLADFGAVALKAEPTAPAEMALGVGVGGGGAQEARIAAGNLQQVVFGEQGWQGFDEEARGLVLDPHWLRLLIVVLFVVQVLIREGKACENVFVQLRKSSINEPKNLLIPL